MPNGITWHPLATLLKKKIPLTFSPSFQPKAEFELEIEIGLEPKCESGTDPLVDFNLALSIFVHINCSWVFFFFLQYQIVRLKFSPYSYQVLSPSKSFHRNLFFSFSERARICAASFILFFIHNPNTNLKIIAVEGHFCHPPTPKSPYVYALSSWTAFVIVSRVVKTKNCRIVSRTQYRL